MENIHIILKGASIVLSASCIALLTFMYYTGLDKLKQIFVPCGVQKVSELFTLLCLVLALSMVGEVIYDVPCSIVGSTSGISIFFGATIGWLGNRKNNQGQ